MLLACESCVPVRADDCSTITVKPGSENPLQQGWRCAMTSSNTQLPDVLVSKLAGVHMRPKIQIVKAVKRMSRGWSQWLEWQTDMHLRCINAVSSFEVYECCIKPKEGFLQLKIVQT